MTEYLNKDCGFRIQLKPRIFTSGFLSNVLLDFLSLSGLQLLSAKTNSRLLWFCSMMLCDWLKIGAPAILSTNHKKN